MNPRSITLRSALLVGGVFLCAFLAIQAIQPVPSGVLDLQAVRQNVREAGSYRFAAEIVQSLIPVAAPENIGDSTQQLNLHTDGEVAGPDRTHMQLTFAGDQPVSRLRVITHAGHTYMQKDAELVEIENPAGLSTPNSDPMVWLEGAEDIIDLGGVTENGEQLTHFSFSINGQKLYQYLSSQVNRQAGDPMPDGVVISPPDAYARATGTGEIWVNADGYPVRQLVDISLPGIDALHNARVRVDGTFRDYGQVTRFPLPTQDADGTWRIELTDITPARFEQSAGRGFTAITLPPSTAALLLACLLCAAALAWFRRQRRLALVVLSALVICSLTVLPVLKSFQLISFVEHSAQAAASSQSALSNALDPAAEPYGLQPTEEAPGLPEAVQDLSITLARCGDGAVSSDLDGDGLNDKAESCLGTDPGYSDTDRDLVPDNLEALGVSFGSKNWPSNPFEIDSNQDGLADFAEWPTPVGEAPGWDPDSDGIPNLWDADNDGDGVPDSEDLSPFSYTSATGSASLTLNGSHDAYTYIEIQVRPETETHLRLNRMLMDWPSDTQGQIQDLDASTQDMRLMPLLEITTKQPPQKDFAAHYGASVFNNTPLSDGSIRMYLPLIPDGDGSRTNSFYARLGYQPNTPAVIYWSSVRMIWAVMGKVDHRVNGSVVVDDIPVQTYPEASIRVTGLRVEKNKNFESAIIGFPTTPEDDLRLFNLTFGLSASFLHNQYPDLPEIVQRFSNPNTEPTLLWGVEMSAPDDLPAVDYAMDGHSDEAMVNLSKRASDLLTSRYTPGAHPSLVLAYQHQTGHYNLDQLSQLQTSKSITIALNSIALDTQRGLRQTKYEYSAGKWKAMDMDGILSVVSQRFADLSGDLAALEEKYPDLAAADLQALLINFYITWSAGQVRVVSLAGQPLAPDLRSDQEIFDLLAPNGISSLPVYLLETSKLGQVGAGLLVGHTLQEEWSYQRSNPDSSVFGSGGTLSNIVNYTRTMIPGTADYFVPKLLIKATTAIMAFRTAYQGYQWASSLGQFAKSGGSWSGRVSASSRTLGIIGTVIAVGMIWMNFGLSTDWDSRVSIISNAVYAVIATVITIALFFLSCNPVGAILVAILAIAEVICYLVSGGEFSIMDTVIGAIASFFYDADILTELGDVNFINFRTEAANPQAGISVGQVYKIGDTFTGEIKLTDDGGGGDLNDSYVYGELRGSSSAYGTPTTQRDTSHCTRTSDGKKCKNDTWANFLLTTPGRNVTFSVSSYIRAKTLYEECVFIWGCWTSSTYTDLPEDLDEEDRWDPVDVTLDILPASLDAFTSWTVLTHLDLDGDGLLNTQEPGTGTRSDLWDTDGDRLSDQYEFDSRAFLGVDPLQADGDHDGLDDLMEVRLRTRAASADSDGDALSDGTEVYHFDGANWVGGWQITLPGLSEPVTILSNPKNADQDGDGLSDAAELANSTSPYSYNDAPRLALTPTPFQSGPNGRSGMFAAPDEVVSLTLRLENSSPWPVDDTLELCLPDFFTEVSGGELSGPPAPPALAPLTCGVGFRWDFSGANILQVWQEASTTVTARIDPTLAETTQGEIAAHIHYVDKSGVEQILLSETTVIVDLDAPQVFLTTPDDGAFLGGGILDYVLGGSAADPTSWVERVELGLPEGPREAVGVSPWAYTWDLPADGEYNLSARAFDLMGNASPPVAIHVTVDNTSPVIDTELAQGIFISGTPNSSDLVLALRGSGSDATSGLERIEVSLDGKPWRDAWVDTGEHPRTTTWEKDWEMPNDPSSQGMHNMTVRGFDRAGNASQPLSRSVIADVQPPTSELADRTFLEDPPHYPAGQEIDLRGVANDIGNLDPPLRPVELEGDLSAIAQSTLWLSLAGVGEDDGGVSVSWLGDFNGDRLADLLVGLPAAQAGQGKVVVVNGRAGGWPNPPDARLLDSSRTSFTGTPGAALGSSAVAAGDVNGDGLYDLAIGDPNGNRIFVVFGRPSPYGQLQVLDGTQENGWSVLLPQEGGSIGSRLAPAGDVNFDGVDDLLIADGDRLVVFAGLSGQWPEYVSIPTRSALEIVGDNLASFGRAGDVNGDRSGDFAASRGTNLSLFLGDETYTPGSPQVLSFADADASFSSSATGPGFAALGDVNGDGSDDLIYAAGSDPRLVFGSSGGSFASLPFDHINPRANGFLAAPGDVNGDGLGDILAGTEAGEVYLFLGDAGLSAGAPPPLVHATLTGALGAASTLYPSGADLNSDGSSDLLLIPDPVELDRLEGMEAGFAAPSFIQPEDLPHGVGQAPAGMQPDLAFAPLAPASVFTVDDDGCAGCYTTIGAAIQAAGSSDEIIVQPGVYPAFTLQGKDGLYIHGVNPDAVFVDGQGGDFAVRLANTLGDRIANLTLRNARSPILLESAGVGGYAPASQADRIVFEGVLVYDFYTNAIRMDRASTISVVGSTLAGRRNHINVVGPPDTATTPAWQTVSTDSRLSSSIGGGMYGYSNPAIQKLYFLNFVTDALYIYYPATGTWAPHPIVLSSSTTNSAGAFTPDGRFFLLHASGSSASLSELMGEHDWMWYSDLSGVGPGLSMAFDQSGHLFGLSGGGDRYLRQFDISTPGSPTEWQLASQAAPAGFGVGASLLFAGSTLYALRGDNSPDFYKLNPLDQSWQELADLGSPGQTIPAGAGASLAWDGKDWIYAAAGGNGRQFLRYHIPTNTWELLGDGVSATPDRDVPQSMRAGGGMVVIDGQIYTTVGDNRPGLYRYGPVGVNPVKIILQDTAIVGPENATRIPWYNLDLTHTDDFLIDGNQSTWVGGNASVWSPDPLALPLDCTTYTSTDVPKHFEGFTSQGDLISTLAIPDSQLIRDLNVRRLNYYSTEDALDVYLTSPAGTTIDAANMCPMFTWVNIDLDDEATQYLRERCLASWSVHYWDGTSYHPTDPLSSFDLQDSQGTWTLNINARNYPGYWVGDLAGWGLEVCTGPTTLTYAQARLVDPQRDVYREGSGSQLRAGYHTYHADMTVAASGGDTTSIQAAIDSGANRVLVQPGVYPQSFYLASGVSVIGAGAELSILQPAEAIRAEGVVGASLERLTLQGNAGVTALEVEDGAHNLTFARNIVRGAGTGIQTSGEGTRLEVVNNTLVGNATGMASNGCADTDVRNTIFAENTTAGLALDASCDVSTLHMYNLYWNNGQDLQPLQPGPGEIFLDPLFLAPAEHNYRTAAYSPAGNAGNPSDPAPPGAGERVDIGYIEQGRASFYADDDYCPACLNDSLTWGVDAFATIQEALEAARNLIASLGKAADEPISVGVGPGEYQGPVSVPGSVRLTGSGADRTTLHTRGAEAVVFDGAVRSEISGFTLMGADPSAPDWNRQVAVDGTGVAYGYTVDMSLALLPNGLPRFAYSDPSASDLYYAENDGTAWTTHLVDARPGYNIENTIDGISMALDDLGHPHISYYAYNYDFTVRGLHYAGWDGTAWQVTDLDPTCQDSTAIAVDSQGRPHIAYAWSTGYTGGWGGVRYTYWDGSQWTEPQAVESVNSYLIDYAGLSLQLDDQDRPHISYIKGYNTPGYDVVYAAGSGSAWSLETVEHGYFWMSTSLALDSLGRPHIAYHDSNAGLKYAARTPSWSVQNLEGGESTGMYLSLQLDSADNPHIGYNAGNTLRYAHHDGDAWYRQTVDANNTGSPVSLAVDRNDRAHLVSYYGYYGANDFTYYHASGLGTGVLVKGASNQIVIAHNQIIGNQTAVQFEGRATGLVAFNTLLNATDSGVTSTGEGTWVRLANNIIMALDAGLHTLDGGQIFNDYNLYFGGMDTFMDDAGTGLAQGRHEIVGENPLFENVVAGDYDLLPGSPAVDAADPEEAAPPGGGAHSDIGANELMAPPLMVMLGKEDVSTAIGNSKVAQVQLGVVAVADPASSPLDTLPEDPSGWQPLALQPQGETVAFWRESYQPAADGLYRVYSQAADHVDNQESAPAVLYEGAFIADSTPPEVAWISQDGSTVTSPFELKATAADYPAGELAVVETYFQLEGGQTIRAAGKWSPDPWDSDGHAPRRFSAYLDAPDGEYWVTPYAVDRAGNIGAGPAIRITVSGSTQEDTSPPVLMISTPEDGLVTNGGTSGLVQFAGTVSDDLSGVAGVEVSLDAGINWMAAVVDGSAWSLTWQIPSSLDMVSFPLRYRAVDKAGNEVRTERTLSIDNAWPAGLVPVTFNKDQGMHFDAPVDLELAWNSVTDGSGTKAIKLLADQVPVSSPDQAVTGTQTSLELEANGPWYVHLGVDDETGNSFTRNYGAWYVGNMETACAQRQQSILIDGWADVSHQEWLDTAELLDSDERPETIQSLYATWDAGAFYLGWHGAWWEIDGTLWAYLDTQPGGSLEGADPHTQSLPFEADLAVRIAGEEAGALYRFDGSGWQAEALEFRLGATGDTEVRIPVSTSSADRLGLLAFGLDENDQPWSVFPTTNLLDSEWRDAYTWSDPCAAAPPNQNGPRAVSVNARISTPQGGQIAWGPGSAIQYQIELENREAVPLAGALVNLHASLGLTLTSVDGVECMSCTPGASPWQVKVASLPAGGVISFDARAQVSAELGLVEEVSLSAGVENSSYPAAVYRHASDGQIPDAAVSTLPGNALGAGQQTLFGTALDRGPAGLERVEVMEEGGSWRAVNGADYWVLPLTVPDQAELHIYTRAIDTSGNTGEPLETTFYIDRTAPTASLDLPALLGGSPTAHLTGTAQDPYPAGARVSEVWVQMDDPGQPWQKSAVSPAGEDGAQPWGFTWLLPVEDFVTHSLRVRAVDMAGNLSEPGDWQSTRVDTIAPAMQFTHVSTTISITDYLPGGSGGPVLAGTVFDPGGLQNMTAYVYDSLGGHQEEAVERVDGDWSFTPSFEGPLAGHYQIYIEAVDIAGNVRRAGPYGISVEDQAIADLVVVNNGPITAGQEAVFMAMVSAGTNVTYTWDFGNGETAVGEVVTRFYWQPGEYTITVTASNGSGSAQASTILEVQEGTGSVVYLPVVMK